MEYNTSQKGLVMPEYGRHVHRMVEHAVQIENRELRNIAAYNIIGVMGSLMPHLRDVPDFKHKLWNHLLLISNFKLDIDAPYPPPAKNEMVDKPAKVPYHQAQIRQRHYGKILVKMINEAAKLEDCPQRDSLISLLVTQMRKSHNTWSRSEYSNEQIIQDFSDISGGKIKLNPDLPVFSEPLPKETAVHPQQYQGQTSKRKKKKLAGRR